MLKYLWLSFLIGFALAGCDDKPLSIEKPKYLNSLGYLENRIFLIRETFLKKASCDYIEQWASANLQKTDYYDNYVFLRYNYDISEDNYFLPKEFDAIIGDYEICMMNSIDLECFICKEEKNIFGKFN